MSARKQFFDIELASNRALLDRLRHVDATDVEMDAMTKDWPLVEAALETDRSVASRESVVRKLFAKACGQVGELRTIVWVNPDRPEEEPIAWLEQGAPPDEHRKLGCKT